jgi:hypothetical protein
MPAQVFDYETLAPQVEQALRREFTDGLVEVSQGYLGRVHVLLVSPQLSGLSEEQKQGKIWEILKAELGEESQGVSLVAAYGTDELR